MTDPLTQLQFLWQHFVTMGATDNDLHMLVTVAQDMECRRIVHLLDDLLERPDIEHLDSVSLLRVLRSALEAHEHRPKSA